MGYVTSNHTQHDNPEGRCVLCDAMLIRSATQAREAICLICRAVILDRVFQARRQRARTQARADMNRLRLST
jgi:ABC-type proline/glycine betaine transport system permease subunit